jgi:hypothetical protein
VTVNPANNPAEGATAPDPELANQTQEQQIEQEVDPETGEPVTQAVDDSEEIEHEGKKYRVPKGFNAERLMHADYTRKTQEVADRRREVDERDNALKEQAQLQAAHIQDVARVHAMNERIAEFEKIDWAALGQSNEAEARALWFAYQQALTARTKAAGELQAKVTKSQQDRAAQAAKLKSDLAANLARDIPGYTPELATKMQTFGVATYGFTADEISKTTDPRLHRLLHDAMAGREATAKAAKAAAASQTANAANGLKPVPQVGSTARAAPIPPTSPQSDKTGTAEWMKRRNEQERKARAS